MRFAKKFGAEIARIAITALVLGAVGASGQVYKWSQTPGTNSSADPHINWAEGQAPSSINDSARSMMAALAQYRDDISGSATTGGIATAYTLTTNQGLPATPTDGQLIAFTPNVTNGSAVTLQADGGTAYAIQTAPGTAVGSATLIAGTPYTAKFSLSNTAWILRDFYGNAYSVPLGAFLHSTVSTPPNSNFIIPIGQCISTTTYATYFVSLGSPASGSCAGGQFAVVDVRGRNLTALDTLSSSAANRLTSASTGCGTGFTSMGVTCANGTESKTLLTTNLPPYTPSGTITNGTITFNGGTVGGTAGGGTTGGGQSTPVNASNINVTQASSTFAGSTNGGNSTPLPSVAPNLGVYVFLRVI